MKMIPGLECRILDDACCGLNGSYGFKKINETTAMQLGDRAVSLIKNTGAEAIVADCGSCRMQLAGLSGMYAFDPVEILCESLGIRDNKIKKGDSRQIPLLFDSQRETYLLAADIFLRTRRMKTLVIKIKDKAKRNTVVAP